MNENHIRNGINLIEQFLSVLESDSASKEDRKEALEGIHHVVKSFGRNRDYGDLMEEFGKNKNQHELAIPQSAILAKDLLRRLKEEL